MVQQPNNHNRLYLKATIVSICIILGNQMFIQYWLHQKKGDSETINIAGKQRMISQRLINQTLLSTESPNDSRLESNIQLYQEWKATHSRLIETFNKQKGKLYNDASVCDDLRELTPLIENAKKYIDSSKDGLTDRQLVKFRGNQDLFLSRMNAVVSKIEVVSDRKLNIVIVIEILFALLSLIMIYYEITYVFKRISNDLQEQNTALSESNETLEQYAYLAAHDLATPTQNILNFTSLLNSQLEPRLNDTERTYFQFVTDSAQRMKTATRDLLMFSSINQGNLNVVSCDPQQIIQESINTIKARYPEKDFTIDMSTMPTTIQVDSHLFQIVTTHLIDNAVKFVLPSVIPKVTISSQVTKGYHSFSVSDNGIGISKENREKIFGLFKRLHSGEDYSGTGIGLSLCQKIIEKHGGEISIEGNQMNGSTFIITLPADL